MNDMFSYLSDIEKADLATESAINIEFTKAQVMLEYVDELENIRMKEAELRVLNENGTYDDLVSYYEDVATQANQKKQGVISTLINGIINAITGVINKIKEFFTGKAIEEAQTQLAQNPEENTKGFLPDLDFIKTKIGEAVTAVENWFANRTPTEKVITDLGAIAAVIAAGITIGKKLENGQEDKTGKAEKTKGDFLNDAKTKLSGLCDDLKNKLTQWTGKANADPSKANDAPKVLAPIRGIVATLGNGVGKIFGWIKGLFGGGGEGEEGTNANGKPKTKSIANMSGEELVSNATPDKIRKLKDSTKFSIANKIIKHYADASGGKGTYEQHMIIGKDGNPVSVNIHKDAVNKLGELGLLKESSMDEYDLNMMIESGDQFDVMSECDQMLSILDTL